MNPASSANASKAAAPPKRKASTRNNQPTSAALTSKLAFVPVGGNKTKKTQAKRKRDEGDEGSPTTKRGKAAQDDDKERNLLRRHMEPRFERSQSGRLVSLKHYPLFKLQQAPQSISGGAKCRLKKCGRIISFGEHRIALTPGMTPGHESYKWYYHVRCFANLVDLSSPHYAARFEVDRDDCPPDSGAEDILDRYLSTWKRQSSTAHSASDKGESSKPDHVNKDWALADRMHERIRQWVEREYRRTSNRYQFDPEEHLQENEWDVNKYFLPKTHPEYSERYVLSQALETYEKELEAQDKQQAYDSYDDADDWAL